MPAQVVIPSPGELRGMQICLIRHREKQTVIPAPMLDERSDVQPQVICRFRFCPGRDAPTIKRILVSLVPNRSPIIVRE